jgi:uncharacterized NAD-dependent epimerase/dehydratase family protein
MGRLVLLTEGQTEPHHGKTAAAILRYRGDEVVGLIDSTQDGRTAGELLGVGGDTPIRADLSAFEADELIVGVAPRGVQFPDAWRRIILQAIERGMNVTSGIHFFLGEDAEIAEAARRRGVRLWDVRTPPRDIGVSRDAARHAAPIRIHSVGLECAVGKMTVTIELDRALRAEGIDSQFLATGQTGIMVSNYGLPIDRFVADFIAGGAEHLVLDNLERAMLLIEGQGSLYNPFYSGVTLGLLHGCAPDFLILCHKATQKFISGTDRPLPTLTDAVELYSRCANLIHPCKVIGIGVNTHGLDEAAARAELDRAERETGLPAADVLRFGCEKLVRAVLETPRPSAQA